MRLSTSLLFMPVAGVLAQGSASVYKKRLTGEDLDTGARWGVAGTDLGIPYVLENGSIGYLFGDTFSTQWPDDGNGWRSPVLLRSNVHPGEPDGVIFDSAAGIAGDGLAPEIMYNGHTTDDGAGNFEYSVIPNDGISFPETGQQIISYMSILSWDPWSTNYAGLAISDDGNTYKRLTSVFWNDADNLDPFQMWTMQRDGDYVYIFSVRAGRQDGPMMLRRVKWDQMVDVEAYESWGENGEDGKLAWGETATPLFEGIIGEPSVRKLDDGTWAMVYLDLGVTPNAIVSRTAEGPTKKWSEPKVQITSVDEPNLYGGFIHPWSTSKEGDLHTMVSRWSRDESGHTTHYHMSQYVGTL
ncbi:hypothetical protein FQN54_005002 [Arachnomyces sp. PD_36]|nr:hypothetical protein FQN54_005002 [Arachnomyces sp. PD_36]